MALTYRPPEGATIVNGGNWVATKGPDGKTYYQPSYGTGDGAVPKDDTKYEGPIIIENGNLTVASGAEASGAYLSGGNYNIYIQSGGTLESSTNVNGWTYVSSGGLSSGNTLVSDGGRVYRGGTMIDNSILSGPYPDGGGDTYYIGSHAYVDGTNVVGGGATLDVTTGPAYVESPIDIEPGGTLKITSVATTVGGGQPHSGIANAHPTVNYPKPPEGATVVSGGYWVAYKASDGKTYYQSASPTGDWTTPVGNDRYTGPIIIQNGYLTVASGAVASGAYISGGNYSVYVQPGGTLESSTHINGYTYVSSGGVMAHNTLVSDEGALRSGGSSISNIFIAGTETDGGSDTFVVSSGGYLSGNNINGPGSTLTINSGATVAQPTTNYITEPKEGYLTAHVVSGGYWVAYKASDGKTYYQSASPTGDWTTPVAGTERYTGPIIISGGYLTVASGAVASGAYISGGGNYSVYVQPGGTLESSVHVNGYTYVSSGAVSKDNMLLSDVGNVYSGGTSLNDSILAGSDYDGGSNHDTFTINNGGVITNAYVGSDSTLTIQSGGTSITPTLEAGASYNVYQGQSEVCFLPGTLIRTPSGMVSIETINPGDEVITYVDGIGVPERITWVGQARGSIHSERSDDEAGYPVRILKGAIAENVPFKDMLITAEHCLYFGGKFIPVRMLVNGRSIFYDKSITKYDYYHIETRKHSIIMADGVLTESYLDTGNRSMFMQKGNIFSFRGKQRQTWEDAAAPLTVSREIVEPIFRQIDARADEIGAAMNADAPVLSDDADLHLVTNTGVVLRHSRTTGNHYMFVVPAGVQSVRIMSRVSRPCDAIGPFVDDRRQLGVLVGDVTMFEYNQTWAVTSHLKDVNLSGWSNLEDGSMRWTKGKAELPLGKRQPNHDAVLSIQIVAAGPYVVREDEAKQTALRA